MPADLTALLADLADETASLRTLIDPLPDDEWARPTSAPGWSIADTVGHLAYFDDDAVRAATDPDAFRATRPAAVDPNAIDPDAIAARYRDRSAGDVRAWFGAARARLLEVFAGLDPSARIPWYGPDMSVASAVTARLMETWAHGEDIADGLGVTRDPTVRLRHVAHLGVGARAFSFVAHGRPVPASPVRVELDDGAFVWGPADAPDRVTGSLTDFAYLVTQRRHRKDTGLVITGAAADEWMSIAQAFAGAPGTGRDPR
jgi:uncharacterized protein (TIGR03084 family)